MKRSGEFRNTSKCETVSHKPAITTAATWTSNSLLHFPHWFRSSCRDFLSFADFTDAVCHSSKKLPLLLGSIGIVSAILNLFTAGGQTGVVSVTVQSLSVTWLKVWSATKLPERSYFAKKKKKKKNTVMCQMSWQERRRKGICFALFQIQLSTQCAAVSETLWGARKVSCANHNICCRLCFLLRV